jgi:hypothetical protein
VALAVLALAGCDRSGAAATDDAVPDALQAGDSPGADAEPPSDAAPEAVLPALPDPASFEEGIVEMVTKLASPELAGRDEGTPGGIAAREYVLGLWKACGIEPLAGTGYEQPILTGAGANLLGRIPGSDPARTDRHVLISAHYDHLGTDCADGAYCPGAYDNAVAVAIVTRLACALAADPPARSVIVAAWDAEEPPAFRTEKMGSKYYVANPLVPLAQVDVAIVLDLTGSALWPGYAGHFAIGAETSPRLTAVVDAAAVPEGLEVFRGALHTVEEQVFGHHPWSDYDDFRTAGVPVLFLSDGQTKVYHRAGDTPASVDIVKAGREAAFLSGLLGTLANATETPVFDLGTDYLYDARMVTEVLADALAPGDGVSLLGLQPESIDALKADAERLAGTLARLEGGAIATDADVKNIRTAVQRVMCLSSQLSELLCMAL